MPLSVFQSVQNSYFRKSADAKEPPGPNGRLAFALPC